MGSDDNPQATENRRLPPTDLDLIREARRGGMDAFHRLVDRYASYLYGLAVSLVGNAHDAEDAVQETLIGAFRGLAGFREQSSVKTWLTGILMRQAARHYRRGGWLRGRIFGLDTAPEPTVAAATTRTDLRMDVHAAILTLRPDHREVIVLRQMQGLSYDEMAQVLGVPRGTVESRLFRARRELQELLKEYLT